MAVFKPESHSGPWLWPKEDVDLELGSKPMSKLAVCPDLQPKVDVHRCPKPELPLSADTVEASAAAVSVAKLFPANLVVLEGVGVGDESSKSLIGCGKSSLVRFRSFQPWSWMRHVAH